MSEIEKKSESFMEQATFGAGCFWGVEAAFGKVTGVVETSVGYCGGEVPNPTYEQVCTGRTNHVEVVRVLFDSKKVTYEQLLELFWNIHDPTQVNRQGPDTGSQYRTVIFTHGESQRASAKISKETIEQSGRFARDIATSVEPVGDFWIAEDYHQQFFEKRGVASFSH